MTPVRLTWEPSFVMRVLATVTLIGLVLAALLRHGEVIVLVAPGLVWLALEARPDLPEDLELSLDCSPRRCQEGEPVDLALSVRMPRQSLPLAARCGGQEATEVLDDPRSATRTWRWQVRPSTWGIRPIAHGSVRLTSPAGLWTATLAVRWPGVTVLPAVPASRRSMTANHLRHWPGSRASHVGGDGIEPLGVTAYQPGVPLRRINWRATVRRDQLHVTTFSTERAQDVVIVVDAMVEAGPTGNTTVDRAVRGAAALIRAHIQAGDRVGLVTVTPAIDWIAPGIGHLQMVRLLDRLVSIGDRHSVIPPDLGRIPQAAAPVGSMAILLTPLLNEQSIGLAGDLRRRGHVTVLVDVLAAEPPVERDHGFSRTAHRLWRLDRRATVLAMRDRGILVLDWSGREELGAILMAAASRPLLSPGRKALS